MRRRGWAVSQEPPGVLLTFLNMILPLPLYLNESESARAAAAGVRRQLPAMEARRPCRERNIIFFALKAKAYTVQAVSQQKSFVYKRHTAVV